MNIKNFIYIKIIIHLLYSIFFFKTKDVSFFTYLLKNKKKSKSQIFQDLFVIYYSKFKKKGTFVEIGGGDGINLSNSYFLEKEFLWNGIICEPNPIHFKNIIYKRNCILEKSAIAEKSANAYFYSATKNNDNYSGSLIKKKLFNNKIKINTLSLNDVLKKNKIKNVDYLSVDTEGNEYEIIKSFDFKKYKIKIITIEHNFNKVKRNKIKKILIKNNFINIFSFISYMDDWFINLEN